ncbi:MAG TPA: transporter substrate-binding domain-containing protein [bacterium]|nr:transporter substrate-binding domain-containing protein [bacterium]
MNDLILKSVFPVRWIFKSIQRLLKPQGTEGLRMTHKNRIWFSAVFLVLTAGAVSSGRPLNVIPDTVYIASEPDYPPYCFVNEEGEAAGFSMDLFRAAAAAAGLQVRIKIGIWSKIKQDLAEGRLDALPLVGRTPEREELFDFTMPYLSLHGAVFVRKGTKDINSIGDLKEKSIVVMRGDNAEEFVRRENVSNEIVTTNTFEEAFIALANGHHNAVITQRIMGIELLQTMGIKNVVPLDFHLPEFRQDFCFAVRKGDDRLLSLLNEGLSVIIANKTYEQIRNEWFGPAVKDQIMFKDILRYLLFILVPILIIIAAGAIVFFRKEVKKQTRELKREIAGHKQTLKALQVSEEKYRGMIKNLMEGFYCVSFDGVLLDYNTEFIRILKLDPDKDHTGIKLPDFWQNPDDRKAYLDEIQKKGFIRNYEIKAKTAAGEPIVVTASSRVVKDDKDDSVRIEGSFLDITDRKKALEELYKLKDDLAITVGRRTAELEEKVQKLDKSEKAMLYMVEDLNELAAELQEERCKLLASNQELEAFTYSVSHDLRAPLRAVDGYSKFLLEDYGDKLDTEGKRFIRVIHENAAKMDRLILDLLNLSRISRVDMNLKQADMRKIAESVFHEITSDGEKEAFQFSVEKMPPVVCDTALIKQVWQNLIGNAIKYSSRSEIKKIEIGAEQKDHEIIFFIRDRGAGFDKKYAGKLFGIFQRLHSEEEFPGTGVGLAIVKRIVQRHGGRVWAGGETNRGAVFYFTLPLQQNQGLYKLECQNGKSEPG